jgi:hypothetical protein
VAITLPCYCTREDVKQALDVKETARSNDQLDISIDAASRAVEGSLNRTFYPVLTTRYFDWPNYQYAYPWRLWLNDKELADITVTVPVVTSGGNTIPSSQVFWEPVNSGPPYTSLELDRSSTASFGQGSTPQRDISITGVFGYWVRTSAAGTLAAAISTTTATSIQVSDGSKIGVGDNILIGTERMLVTGRAMVTSGQTQQGSGVSTSSQADVTLAVTDGTAFSVGEVLLLGSERMLIVDISGNNLTVKRAWDGSVLATHSGATVYASRTLTVTRGDLGTTAATHSNSAPVSVALVPSLVRELTIAEALNYILQKQAGYARTAGTGDNQVTFTGRAIETIRQQAQDEFGRKSRQRVV